MDSVIACGHVLQSPRLYTFSSSSYPCISRAPSASLPTAYVACRIPDIETWHRHLGHLSPDTIVSMARSEAVQGMPINISFSSFKCNSCVLGKQTRASVPKLREGVQVTRPLKRVFLLD
jgi:hypothetical protein